MHEEVKELQERWTEEREGQHGMKNGQRYPIGYSRAMDKAILAKEVLESELEVIEARGIRIRKP